MWGRAVAGKEGRRSFWQLQCWGRVLGPHLRGPGLQETFWELPCCGKERVKWEADLDSGKCPGFRRPAIQFQLCPDSLGDLGLGPSALTLSFLLECEHRKDNLNAGLGDQQLLRTSKIKGVNPHFSELQSG